jgi:hypothetical protein
MDSPANVLIGLPMEDSVKAEFFKSFFGAVNLLPEEGNFLLKILKWRNIVTARNETVEDCLKGDFTHLFFMDSDMEFPENALARLLEHDKDIVGGIYPIKLPPYHTTAGMREPGKNWRSIMPDPGERLMKVDMVATGCMLIKRRVLELMDWPYFQYVKAPDDEKNFTTEDNYFCMKAQELGLEIWCDASVRCGHVGSGKVSLEDYNGEVKIRLEMV